MGIGSGWQIGSGPERFENALTAFDKTIELAQSYPAIYKQRARTVALLMLNDMFEMDSLTGYLEKGILGLTQCMEILPNDEESLLLKAWLQYCIGRRVQIENGNPQLQFEQAISLAEDALQIGTDTSKVHLLLGLVYARFAEWRNGKSQDAGALTKKAIAELDQVAAGDRNANFYYNLALTWKSRASDLGRKGQDNCEALQNHVDATRKLMALRPGNGPIMNDLSLSLYKQAEKKDCAKGNSIGLLKEAVTHLTEAIGLNPNHLVYRYQLGRTWRNIALGGSSFYRGVIDLEAAEKALEQLQLCKEINPRILNPTKARGWIYLCRARYIWEQGGQPELDFKRALDTFREGLAIDPSNASLAFYIATARYFQGKYKVREGKDPGQSLEEAIAVCKRALTQLPDQRVMAIMGNAFLIQAEHASQKGKGMSILLDQAREAFEKVLIINPSNQEAHRSMGRYYTLVARNLHNGRKDPQPAFSSARSSLDNALNLAPDSTLILLTDARWFLEYATLMGPERLSPFKQHLMDLQNSLAARDYLPEAQAAEIGLAIITPDSPSPQNEGQLKLRLQQVFACNPHLRFEWATMLAGSERD